MNVLAKAFQGFQQHAASTNQAGAFRVSHSGFRPPIFDGYYKQGEDIQQRVMVFGRDNAYFWEMGCLEAMETTVPIKVGLKESSQEALIAEIGDELVGKASRASEHADEPSIVPGTCRPDTSNR